MGESLLIQQDPTLLKPLTPSPGAGGRLMFDATEQFHHAGRYTNHVGGNLKLMGPYYIREKWRVRFIAIRVIVGEELCYDYGE